jgi:hypothetical protein
VREAEIVRVAETVAAIAVVAVDVQAAEGVVAVAVDVLEVAGADVLVAAVAAEVDTSSLNLSLIICKMADRRYFCGLFLCGKDIPGILFVAASKKFSPPLGGKAPNGSCCYRVLCSRRKNIADIHFS